MTSRNVRFASAFALSIAVCLAITVTYVLRVGYAPDEWNHLSMVRHHSETLRLATWEDMRFGGERGHAYQLFSPMPYCAHVIFLRIARIFTEPENAKAERRLVRLGGLPLVVLQFWVIYLIARLVFRSRWQGLGASLVVNLLPQLRYIQAYINADAASLLMGSAGAWLILRFIMGERPSGRTAVLTGLALAGLALAKYNVWIMALALCAVFMIRTLKTTSAWSHRVRLITTAFLFPVLLAGWFHLHVYVELSNGHVLGSHDHLQLMHSTYSGVPDRVSMSMADRLREIPMIWSTAMGNFVRIGRLPGWYLHALLAGILAGTTAVVFVSRRTSSRHSKAIALYYVLGLVVSMLTYYLLARQGELRIQGRLLLGVLPFALVPLWALDRSIGQLTQVKVLRSACPWVGAVFLLAGNLFMIRKVLGI